MADFGQAGLWLSSGMRVQRRSWEPKGIWLLLAGPGVTSLPCIIVHRRDGQTAPWQACHNDLLAADWQALGGLEHG